MLRIYKLYLPLLVLLVFSFINFSCAPTVVTETTPSSSENAVTSENVVSLVVHDKDCSITDSVYAVKGSSSIRILFYILGDKARPSYYSFGYKPLNGAPTPEFTTESRSGAATQQGSTTYMYRGKLVLPSGTGVGTYSYKLVLRDVQTCYEVKGDSSSKCDLSNKSNKKLSSTNSSYDVTKEVTINVVEDAAAQQAALNAGLTIGKTLISSLAGDNKILSTVVDIGSELAQNSNGSTTVETAVDPSAKENGCYNGWPLN